MNKIKLEAVIDVVVDELVDEEVTKVLGVDFDAEE